MEQQQSTQSKADQRGTRGKKKPAISWYFIHNMAVIAVWEIVKWINLQWL